jgi:hypothetical protein
MLVGVVILVAIFGSGGDGFSICDDSSCCGVLLLLMFPVKTCKAV